MVQLRLYDGNRMSESTLQHERMCCDPRVLVADDKRLDSVPESSPR